MALTEATNSFPDEIATMPTNLEPPTFAEVLLLTQQNALAIQQLTQRMDRVTAERQAESVQRELERKQEAERRRIEEEKQAAAEKKRQAEINALRKDMTRRTNKLEEFFVGQWGKLVESLVEGKLVELFNERDIKVQRTIDRLKGSYGGKNIEIDLVAINGNEVIVVEVKTTLRVSDLDTFESKLKIFREWMPEFADKKVYGAVAFIDSHSGSTERAAKRGLFIIKAVGDSAKIENSPNFRPRSF